MRPEKNVKMIVVDLDGTLLNLEAEVSARNAAALRSAEAAGIMVVVATGRRHCYAMRVLREVGLGAETVLVSSNGAVTRTMGDARLIDRTVMSLEAARALCGHLGEYRNALVITFDKVQPDGEDARGALVVEELADLHTSIAKWMTSNAPYLVQVDPIEEALQHDEPIQMMLCGTVARMRAAEARMLEMEGVSAVGHLVEGAAISLSRTEYPGRDLSLVDILPGGCSKGAALVRLAGTMGIAPDEIMAMGDNWNDLSMLEIAGFPVLMGNAPEDLQVLAAEKGWPMAGMHDEDGVAVVVEGLLVVAQKG